MPYKKIFLSLLVLSVISISVGLNIYQWQQNQDLLKETATKTKIIAKFDPTKCPEGMVCKDFKWVSDYVDVLEGEIKWSDCGEGQNKCALWEDYSGQNTLPRIRVKQCDQQGTRLQDGKWTTGLPQGEHTLVGTTIRPCKDIVELKAKDTKATKK